MPTTDYQLWRHAASTDLWAIRIEYGALTGVAGPYARATPPRDLAEVSYEEHPDDLEWFIRACEDFVSVRA